MAEYKGFFDAVDGSPEYDSALFSKFKELYAKDGVVYGYLDEMATAQGSGLEVEVSSGGVISGGRHFITDALQTLSIDAASAGYLRKDRVVVEFDTDNSSAMLKINKGTEAVADPQLPSLVDTSAKWQIGIAIVSIDAGAITAVTDDRSLGNSRVNPDFSENISAPNISAEGSLSSNSLSTGHITSTGILNCASNVNVDGSISADGNIQSGGNITIEDDGKLFLNTAKTAYIRFDDTEKGIFVKIPGCYEVQLATLLVGTDENAPSGTYPKNSIYLEREA